MAGFCECGCGGEARRRFIKGHAWRGRCRDGGPDYEIDEVTGCWVWRGTKVVKGYGTRIQDGKTVLAHRMYYERVNGPIPDGLVIDHLCRNTSCVNPDHLEPVTSGENVRRGKGAKLTWALADEIRDAIGSHRKIAARYDISHNLVGKIKRGLAWQR